MGSPLISSRLDTATPIWSRRCPPTFCRRSSRAFPSGGSGDRRRSRKASLSCAPRMRALSPARHFRSTAASTCTDGNRRKELPLSVAGYKPLLGKAPCRICTTRGEHTPVHWTICLHDLASTRSSSADVQSNRSEEHTSELQSLMRISYAVFCLKKKIHKTFKHTYHSFTRH